MSVGRCAGLVLVLVLSACSGSEALAADAGADFDVVVGEAPTFDACGSSGSINSYSWVITEAPEAMADDAGKPLKLDSTDCSFQLENAMGLSEVGTWVIELTVEDGDATSTDQVAVEVSNG